MRLALNTTQSKLCLPAVLYILFAPLVFKLCTFCNIVLSIIFVIVRTTIIFTARYKQRLDLSCLTLEISCSLF